MDNVMKHQSVPPVIDPQQVRLEEFMAAFEIAGLFHATSVSVSKDDLEAIPYGGSC